MSIAICTLFEKHFHHGAAALINSLVRGGFKGTFVVGHKGPAPDWSKSPSPKSMEHRLCVADGFELLFLQLTPDRHLAYHKPAFLKEVLNTHCPNAGQAIYLDPDIVVKCRASLLDLWCHDGIAVVEDINPNMPSGHPVRLEWKALLEARRTPPRRELERYYNSGFVGVPRTQLDFCDAWTELMEWVMQHLDANAGIKAGGADALFHSTDQDAMNMALMRSHHPIHAAGPDAMDFIPGGILLSHAVGQPKPWQGGFIKRALQGYAPSAASKHYWANVDGPICTWSTRQIRAQRRALKIASLISRFHRRS